MLSVCFLTFQLFHAWTSKFVWLCVYLLINIHTHRHFPPLSYLCLHITLLVACAFIYLTISVDGHSPPPQVFAIINICASVRIFIKVELMGQRVHALEILTDISKLPYGV